MLFVCLDDSESQLRLTSRHCFVGRTAALRCERYFVERSISLVKDEASLGSKAVFFVDDVLRLPAA
ncbi:MAG: hypothetical protein AAF970_19485, partial [Bacteroidota bacterium]